MISASRPHGATSALSGAPLAALLVVALATRPQLAAIGPMADSIIADLGVSHAFVGLLTTIPVLCMGAFALFGPSLAHLVGVRAGIGLSIGVLVLFGVLRAIAPGAVSILLLTFGVGVGTGVVGPILPMFVRGRLPSRMVAGTAAYAAGTILGAGVGSGIAVPLETVTGSWRGSLLVLSVLSAAALVVWLVLVRGVSAPRAVSSALAANRVADLAAGVPSATAPPRPRVEVPALPWRRLVAWAIGLLFGLQSWLYYGTSAWLANVYVERGWDPMGAAALLTLMSLASLSAIVLVPHLSGRGASRRTLLVAGAGLSAIGLVGITVVPDPAVLWTACIGLGLGATFTLVLTLPTDISDDAREVGGAAAMMLLVGYLIASVAPFVLPSMNSRPSVTRASGRSAGESWVRARSRSAKSTGSSGSGSWL